MMMQAGPFSVNQVSEICTPVAKTLDAVFETVHTYGAHIPSFGHSWAYHVACKQASTLDAARSVFPSFSAISIGKCRNCPFFRAFY